MANKKGITFVGNIITDVVKTVDCYPEIGLLANIKDVKRAVGGAVPNTAINLRKIDGKIPLSAIGKIGNDDGGSYIMEKFKEFNIDASKVVVSEDKPTSFSDVISLPTGERTFFHARGANAQFVPEDIDLDALDCDILHAGYILLLDGFDAKDEVYGTKMAHFFKDVQDRGIKTSVDVVSDATADYKATILPALKYCDYAIMNEIESTTLFDIQPYNADGSINSANIKKTMELMADAGVKEKIVLHCKEAGFAYDVKTKTFTAVPSLKIPSELIKGSVGAGDSYCAGTLFGLYYGRPDKEILEFASCAAACNLFSENSIDGMRSYEEVKKLADQFGRKEIKL